MAGRRVAAPGARCVAKTCLQTIRCISEITRLVRRSPVAQDNTPHAIPHVLNLQRLINAVTVQLITGTAAAAPGARCAQIDWRVIRCTSRTTRAVRPILLATRTPIHAVRLAQRPPQKIAAAVLPVIGKVVVAMAVQSAVSSFQLILITSRIIRFVSRTRGVLVRDTELATPTVRRQLQRTSSDS